MKDKNEAANKAAHNYLATEIEAAFEARALELEFLKAEHQLDDDFRKIPYEVFQALDSILDSLHTGERLIEHGYVNMGRDSMRRNRRRIATILKRDIPPDTHAFEDFEINGKAKTDAGRGGDVESS